MENEDCKSVAKTAATIWEKYRALVPKGTPAGEYVKVALAMSKEWDQVVNQAAPGARPHKLTFGEAVTGKVSDGGARTYLSERPVNGEGKVHFRKEKGGASATMKVCSFDEGGEHRDVRTIEVGGDVQDGREYEVPVPQDAMVSVSVDSPEGHKKLEYTVRLSA